MAAQPPLPPPRNLLFCGPPALPPVILLPAPPRSGSLHLINTVGVPCDAVFADSAVHNNLRQKDLNLETHHVDRCMRRTQSFDTADVCERSLEFGIDTHALKISRSQPDLSRCGLFLQAEVAMEPPPVQASLVLNNPFYDNSCAIGAEQAIVMMPENYLAFEDSFVPVWDHKKNGLDDTKMDPDKYHDRIPILRPNDPWTAYGNDIDAFEYYTTQYDNPHGLESNFSYMPLTDLEYAIPQYMSLPVIEQAKVENVNTDVSEFAEQTSMALNKYSEISENVESTSQPNSTLLLEDVPTSFSEVITDDDIVSSNGNRTQSEESLNADISCDVTSSLAFVPCSVSSQIPNGADDTGEDTSPCSTDYHEASALDIAQSRVEHSCYNSTDFSQSRDDLSATQPESATSQNLCKEMTPNLNENIALSDLPSIPSHERIPRKLPPVPDSELHKELLGSFLSKNNVNVVNDRTLQPGSANQCKITQNELKGTGQNQSKGSKQSKTIKSEPNKNKECEEISNTKQTKDRQFRGVQKSSSSYNVPTSLPSLPKEPPHPPAVPKAWLTNSEEAPEVLLSPQLCIQDPQGVTIHVQPAAPEAPRKESLPANVEQQPSCSFAASEPTMAQLTPDGPPEVEVRHPRHINLLSNFIPKCSGNLIDLWCS